MAVNMFLKLDGVAGESTHKGHKDEIEVLSFSWGVAHPVPVTRGNERRRAGRAQASDITFMMAVGKASPTLMLACATGRHLKEGLFVIEKAGETPFAFYKLTVTDILVSSYQTSGASELPMDSFSLNFRTVRLRETVQDAKGAPGEFVETAFDFGRNRQIS
jgi:type VI secretion system secreted protein Hcp